MIGWFIFGGYCCVGLYVWPRAAYVIAHDMTGKPDAGDVSAGLVIGFIVAWVWPLTITVYTLAHHGELLRPPRHVKRKLEAAERERRIAELEREVGIR